MKADFDVVVVGASVAGCTAARLFGQAGARVAVVEQRPQPDAYKVVCTHAILSSAAPTIERIGLAPRLRARGAPRILGDAWTPYGGWIEAPADAPRGWGVTRRTLDPMMRELAMETPGVELLLGRTATRLLTGPGGRFEGVEATTPDHDTATLRAPLVVGADGRHSTTARLARVPGRVRPNARFAYFAYWRGLPRTDRARLWFLDPSAAAWFPNEDDVAMLAAVAPRTRLPEFRADREGSYLRWFDDLPDGPDLSQGERVSKLIGGLEASNVIRPASRPGLAFVGDAAQATDPLFGVGLSWAFQSAEWLADETADALLNGGDLDAALVRYRRTFRRRLALHHFVICDYSTGRPMYGWERAFYRAASVADDALAHAVDEIASRRRSPLRLLDPRLTPSLVRGLVAGRRVQAAVP